MIVSFHPIIQADRNIICAGRQPDDADRQAIAAAAAVILPQGCPEALYRMARAGCPNVFPNLDVRFDYPRKNGQIRLFRKLGVPHPETQVFASLSEYRRLGPGQPFEFPLVVKLDWGGEGETVFEAGDPAGLERILGRVAACERSGQYGFQLQAFVPAGGRCLRVALIGDFMASYWRVQTRPERFGTSVSGGAQIVHDADPELQQTARQLVRDFKARTGLSLAGFDFLFDQRDLQHGRIAPLMLEINYFFGRVGLGGSEVYYKILEREVDAWLSGRGLVRRPA